jgi:ketosteroid isomerase-like protein
MALTRIDIAARLEAAYEALSVDDVALFLAAFSPVARWSMQGNIAGLPFAGNQTGHAEIVRMIRHIYDEFKMRDFFIEDIIVGETSAAVRWSALATSKHTGRQQQLDVFYHIVLDDGLIVSLTQFFDTAAIADAAGRMRRVSGENSVT